MSSSKELSIVEKRKLAIAKRTEVRRLFDAKWRPLELVEVKANDQYEQNYTQEQNYKSFKLFTIMDIESAGSISLRAINRLMLPKREDMLVISFETADCGIKWGLDVENNIVVNGLEPGSPASTELSIVIGLNLRSINGKRVPKHDSKGLEFLYKELILIEGAVTFEFIEPLFCITGYCNMLDIMVLDTLYTITLRMGAYNNATLLEDDIMAALTEVHRSFSWIDVKINPEHRQVTFECELFPFRLMFLSGPNFQRSCRFALGFAAEDTALSQKHVGEPLSMCITVKGVTDEELAVLVAEMFHLFDQDGNGRFNFEEFRDFYVRFLGTKDSMDLLHRLAQYRFRDLEKERVYYSRIEAKEERHLRRLYLREKYSAVVKEQLAKINAKSVISTDGLKRVITKGPRRLRTMVKAMQNFKEGVHLDAVDEEKSDNEIEELRLAEKVDEESLKSGYKSEMNDPYGGGLTGKKLKKIAESESKELEDKKKSFVERRRMLKQEQKFQIAAQGVKLKRILDELNIAKLKSQNEILAQRENEQLMLMQSVHEAIRRKMRKLVRLSKEKSSLEKSIGQIDHSAGQANGMLVGAEKMVVRSPAAILGPGIYASKLSLNDIDIKLMSSKLIHPGTSLYFLVKKDMDDVLKASEEQLDDDYIVHPIDRKEVAESGGSAVFHPAFFGSDHVLHKSTHSSIATMMLQQMTAERSIGERYRRINRIERVMSIPTADMLPEGKEISLVRRRIAIDYSALESFLPDEDPVLDAGNPTIEVMKRLRRDILGRITNILSIRIDNIPSMHMFKRNSLFVLMKWGFVEAGDHRFCTVTEAHTNAGAFAHWVDLFATVKVRAESGGRLLLMDEKHKIYDYHDWEQITIYKNMIIEFCVYSGRIAVKEGSTGSFYITSDSKFVGSYSVSGEEILNLPSCSDEVLSGTISAKKNNPVPTDNSTQTTEISKILPFLFASERSKIESVSLCDDSEDEELLFRERRMQHVVYIEDQALVNANKSGSMGKINIVLSTERGNPWDWKLIDFEREARRMELRRLLEEERRLRLLRFSVATNTEEFEHLRVPFQGSLSKLTLFDFDWEMLKSLISKDNPAVSTVLSDRSVFHIVIECGENQIRSTGILDGDVQTKRRNGGVTAHLYKILGTNSEDHLVFDKNCSLEWEDLNWKILAHNAELILKIKLYIKQPKQLSLTNSVVHHGHSESILVGSCSVSVLDWMNLPTQMTGTTIMLYNLNIVQNSNALEGTVLCKLRLISVLENVADLEAEPLDFNVKDAAEVESLAVHHLCNMDELNELLTKSKVRRMLPPHDAASEYPLDVQICSILLLDLPNVHTLTKNSPSVRVSCNDWSDVCSVSKDSYDSTGNFAQFDDLNWSFLVLENGNDVRFEVLSGLVAIGEFVVKAEELLSTRPYGPMNSLGFVEIFQPLIIPGDKYRRNQGLESRRGNIKIKLKVLAMPKEVKHENLIPLPVKLLSAEEESDDISVQTLPSLGGSIPEKDLYFRFVIVDCTLIDLGEEFVNATCPPYIVPGKFEDDTEIYPRVWKGSLGVKIELKATSSTPAQNILVNKGTKSSSVNLWYKENFKASEVSGKCWAYTNLNWIIPTTLYRDDLAAKNPTSKLFLAPPRMDSRAVKTSTSSLVVSIVRSFEYYGRKPPGVDGELKLPVAGCVLQNLELLSIPCGQEGEILYQGIIYSLDKSNPKSARRIKVGNLRLKLKIIPISVGGYSDTLEWQNDARSESSRDDRSVGSASSASSYSSIISTTSVLDFNRTNSELQYPFISVIYSIVIYDLPSVHILTSNKPRLHAFVGNRWRKSTAVLEKPTKSMGSKTEKYRWDDLNWTIVWCEPETIYIRVVSDTIVIGQFSISVEKGLRTAKSGKYGLIEVTGNLVGEGGSWLQGVNANTGKIRIILRNEGIHDTSILGRRVLMHLKRAGFDPAEHNNVLEGFNTVDMQKSLVSDWDGEFYENVSVQASSFRDLRSGFENLDQMAGIYPENSTIVSFPDSCSNNGSYAPDSVDNENVEEEKDDYDDNLRRQLIQQEEIKRKFFASELYLANGKDVDPLKSSKLTKDSVVRYVGIECIKVAGVDKLIDALNVKHDPEHASVLMRVCCGDQWMEHTGIISVFDSLQTKEDANFKDTQDTTKNFSYIAWNNLQFPAVVLPGEKRLFSATTVSSKELQSASGLETLSMQFSIHFSSNMHCIATRSLSLLDLSKSQTIVFDGKERIFVELEFDIPADILSQITSTTKISAPKSEYFGKLRKNDSDNDLDFRIFVSFFVDKLELHSAYMQSINDVNDTPRELVPMPIKDKSEIVGPVPSNLIGPVVFKSLTEFPKICPMSLSVLSVFINDLPSNSKSYLPSARASNNIYRILLVKDGEVICATDSRRSLTSKDKSMLYWRNMTWKINILSTDDLFELLVVLIDDRDKIRERLLSGKYVAPEDYLKDVCVIASILVNGKDLEGLPRDSRGITEISLPLKFRNNRGIIGESDKLTRNNSSGLLKSSVEELLEDNKKYKEFMFFPSGLIKIYCVLGGVLNLNRELNAGFDLNFPLLVEDSYENEAGTYSEHIEVEIVDISVESLPKFHRFYDNCPLISVFCNSWHLHTEMHTGDVFKRKFCWDPKSGKIRDPSAVEGLNEVIKNETEQTKSADLNDVISEPEEVEADFDFSLKDNDDDSLYTLLYSAGNLYGLACLPVKHVADLALSYMPEVVSSDNINCQPEQFKYSTVTVKVQSAVKYGVLPQEESFDTNSKNEVERLDGENDDAVDLGSADPKDTRDLNIRSRLVEVTLPFLPVSATESDLWVKTAPTLNTENSEVVTGIVTIRMTIKSSRSAVVHFCEPDEVKVYDDDLSINSRVSSDNNSEYSGSVQSDILFLDNDAVYENFEKFYSKLINPVKSSGDVSVNSKESENSTILNKLRGKMSQAVLDYVENCEIRKSRKLLTLKSKSEDAISTSENSGLSRIDAHRLMREFLLRARIDKKKLKSRGNRSLSSFDSRSHQSSLSTFGYERKRVRTRKAAISYKLNGNDSDDVSVMTESSFGTEISLFDKSSVMEPATPTAPVVPISQSFSESQYAQRLKRNESLRRNSTLSVAGTIRGIVEDAQRKKSALLSGSDLDSPKSPNDAILSGRRRNSSLLSGTEIAGLVADERKKSITFASPRTDGTRRNSVVPWSVGMKAPVSEELVTSTEVVAPDIASDLASPSAPGKKVRAKYRASVFIPQSHQAASLAMTLKMSSKKTKEIETIQEEKVEVIEPVNPVDDLSTLPEEGEGDDDITLNDALSAHSNNMLNSGAVVNIPEDDELSNASSFNTHFDNDLFHYEAPSYKNMFLPSLSSLVNLNADSVDIETENSNYRKFVIGAMSRLITCDIVDEMVKSVSACLVHTSAGASKQVDIDAKYLPHDIHRGPLFVCSNIVNVRSEREIVSLVANAQVQSIIQCAALSTYNKLIGEELLPIVPFIPVKKVVSATAKNIISSEVNINVKEPKPEFNKLKRTALLFSTYVHEANRVDQLLAESDSLSLEALSIDSEPSNGDPLRFNLPSSAVVTIQEVVGFQLSTIDYRMRPTRPYLVANLKHHRWRASTIPIIYSRYQKETCSTDVKVDNSLYHFSKEYLEENASSKMDVPLELPLYPVKLFKSQEGSSTDYKIKVVEYDATSSLFNGKKAIVRFDNAVMNNIAPSVPPAVMIDDSSARQVAAGDAFHHVNEKNVRMLRAPLNSRVSEEQKVIHDDMILNFFVGGNKSSTDNANVSFDSTSCSSSTYTLPNDNLMWDPVTMRQTQELHFDIRDAGCGLSIGKFALSFEHLMHAYLLQRFQRFQMFLRFKKLLLKKRRTDKASVTESDKKYLEELERESRAHYCSVPVRCIVSDEFGNPDYKHGDFYGNRGHHIIKGVVRCVVKPFHTGYTMKRRSSEYFEGGLWRDVERTGSAPSTEAISPSRTAKGIAENYATPLQCHRVQHWSLYPVPPISVGKIRQSYTYLPREFDKQMIIHPAFFGYKIRWQGAPEHESRFVHPMFSGYTLDRKAASHEQVEELAVGRTAYLVKTNPFKYDPTAAKNGNCIICGYGLIGCPRCFMLPPKANGERTCVDDFCYNPKRDEARKKQKLDRQKQIEREEAEQKRMFDMFLKTGKKVKGLKFSATSSETTSNYSSENESGSETSRSSVSSYSEHGNQDTKDSSLTKSNLDARYEEAFKEFLERSKREREREEVVMAVDIHTQLTTFRSVKLYRELHEKVVTVFVKVMPTGAVTKLKVSSTDTFFHLNNIYNAHCPGSGQFRMIVLPTSKGIFELGGKITIEDEFMAADISGRTTLDRFGFNKQGAKLVLFSFERYIPSNTQVLMAWYLAKNSTAAGELSKFARTDKNEGVSTLEDSLPVYEKDAYVPSDPSSDPIQKELLRLISYEYYSIQLDEKHFYEELGADFRISEFEKQQSLQKTIAKRTIAKDKLLRAEHRRILSQLRALRRNYVGDDESYRKAKAALEERQDSLRLNTEKIFDSEEAARERHRLKALLVNERKKIREYDRQGGELEVEEYRHHIGVDTSVPPDLDVVAHSSRLSLASLKPSAMSSHSLAKPRSTFSVTSGPLSPNAERSVHSFDSEDSEEFNYVEDYEETPRLSPRKDLGEHSESALNILHASISTVSGSLASLVPPMSSPVKTASGVGLTKKSVSFAGMGMIGDAVNTIPATASSSAERGILKSSDASGRSSAVLKEDSICSVDTSGASVVPKEQLDNFLLAQKEKLVRDNVSVSSSSTGSTFQIQNEIQVKKVISNARQSFTSQLMRARETFLDDQINRRKSTSASIDISAINFEESFAGNSEDRNVSTAGGSSFVVGNDILQSISESNEFGELNKIVEIVHSPEKENSQDSLES